MKERITCSNMSEESISQSLSFTRSLDQSCDVYNVKEGRLFTVDSSSRGRRQRDDKRSEKKEENEINDRQENVFNTSFKKEVLSVSSLRFFPFIFSSSADTISSFVPGDSKAMIIRLITLGVQ